MKAMLEGRATAAAESSIRSKNKIEQQEEEQVRFNLLMEEAKRQGEQAIKARREEFKLEEEQKENT